MKQKLLLITTIIFFLIINTTYFWQTELGVWAMPVFFIQVLVFFILAIAVLLQIVFAINEKFASRPRLVSIGVVTLLLCLALIFPAGIINFERFNGNDLLVAQREGVANCMTTLKLKDNNTFTEKNVCFSVSETKGTYRIIQDTIYFENVQPGRNQDSFYKFAVIRPSRAGDDKKHFNLVRFKHLNDPGNELSIIKNDLNKPRPQSRTAKLDEY